jgi:hypothetical protein
MTGQKIGLDPDGEAVGNSHPASGPLPVPQQGIRGFIGYLISCCPYTMLGKKILRFLRGETGTPNEPLNNRELYLQGQVKIGFGIMLIGVFCPVFWFSFLLGTRGNGLIFNAVCSSIVILFGLMYIVIYRIQLRNEQTNGEHREKTS